MSKFGQIVCVACEVFIAAVMVWICVWFFSHGYIGDTILSIVTMLMYGVLAWVSHLKK